MSKGHREQHRKTYSSIVTMTWGKNAFWQFNMALSYSAMIAKFSITFSLCSGCFTIKSDILKNWLKLFSGHCFTKYFSPVSIPQKLQLKPRNAFSSSMESSKFLFPFCFASAIVYFWIFNLLSSYPEVHQKYLLKYEHDWQ